MINLLDGVGVGKQAIFGRVVLEVGSVFVIELSDIGIGKVLIG